MAANVIKYAVVGLLAAALGVGVFMATSRNDSAPPLAFTSITNQKTSLPELKGKVVLVNFWATSCPGCVHEMPALVATHDKYQARGLETIAVAMSYDPPNYVLSYAEGNKLPFFVTLDTQGTVANAFGGIVGTPTTFLIDRRGRIIRRYLGELDFKELHALLDATLAEPA